MEANKASLDQRSDKDRTQTGRREKERDGCMPQTLVQHLPTDPRPTTNNIPPQESQAQADKSTRDPHTPAARGRDTIRRCRRSVWDLEIAASKSLNRTVTTVEPKAHIEQPPPAEQLHRERESRLSAQLETCLQPTQSLIDSTTT